MRTALFRSLAAVLAAGGSALLPAAAVAAPTPSPGPRR